MVTRLGFDYGVKLAVFSISDTDDVEKLPLTNRAGIDEASTYEACAPGSKAFLTDGSAGRYVLDSKTNTWKSEA